MRANAYPVLLALMVFSGCGLPTVKNKDKAEKTGHVIRETIATGDTTLYRLSTFKKSDLRDDLCQSWELRKSEASTSPELIYDPEGNLIHPQYNFFKDGSVLENPRHQVRLGKWKISGRDTISISLNDSTERKWLISDLDSRELRLTGKNVDGKKILLNLSGNGLVHRNMYNDPFHPVNNQWRIKPDRALDTAAIKQRVIDCIKFYSLFYRDHLLRNRSVINFEGLPKIFNWYNNGLGLPEKSEVDISWINCFYDRKEAMMGYYFLERLLGDYDYEWPQKTNDTDWWHRTHYVLEQIYHRANKIREHVKLRVP
jgi:hypothetical protein